MAEDRQHRIGQEVLIVPFGIEILKISQTEFAPVVGVLIVPFGIEISASALRAAMARVF